MLKHALGKHISRVLQLISAVRHHEAVPGLPWPLCLAPLHTTATTTTATSPCKGPAGSGPGILVIGPEGTLSGKEATS